MRIFLAAALIALASNAFAEEKKAQGPCKEIKEACEKAGFVKGEAKEGYGLWVDCIDPIMKGAAQPPNAKKPLPSVSPRSDRRVQGEAPEFRSGEEEVA
jgi:hypothetical protein